MFAVIRTGGKQYKVSPGDVLEVERLDQEVSAKFVLDDVLLVGGDDELIVGSPKIEGAGRGMHRCETHSRREDQGFQIQG